MFCELRLVDWNRVTESLPPGASLNHAMAISECFSFEIRLPRESMDAEFSLEDDTLVLIDTLLHSSSVCFESFSLALPMSPTS